MTTVTQSGRRAGFEWAVAEAPHPGQEVSGDAALVVALGNSYLLAVIDGLGHGEPACEAAREAIRTVEANSTEPLDILLVLCHEALQSTRGAAMTLGHLDVDSATLEWVGVGNVEAHLVRGGPSGLRPIHSPVLSGGIVGYNLPKVAVRKVQLRHGDFIAIATDGISPAFDHSLRLGLDVASLAVQVIDSCSKGTDDALVLVSRYWGEEDERG